MLAGTAPRGAGAEDERLAAALLDSAKDRAEHALAVDSLVDALEPFCAELDVPAEPELLTLANVRHLATDVTGTQRRTARGRRGCWSWSARCTRPPRCAARPTADAAALIAELEGMDRGRYAGPVGWLDARGDGEFGLALRCAELTGPTSAPGCSPAAASSPAPTRPPSWPRPRRSSPPSRPRSRVRSPAVSRTR